jgi:SAM-dependent methyltransferase
MTALYSESFYDDIRSGVQSSARAIMDVLATLFPTAQSLLDIGCGEGWWCAEWARREGDRYAFGVDGAYVIDRARALHAALGARVAFGAVDVAVTPIPRFPASFDLVLCLEVAEHLPAERAESLITELCAAGKVVVFSGAVPGQGGTGHISERWQSEWAALFAAQGYTCLDLIRPAVWDDAGVEPWYRQNTLVYVDQPKAGDLPAMLDVVHPNLR